MFFEVQIDLAIPNREGVTVKRQAGDVILESAITPGAIESCLRLKQIVACDAPAAQQPTPPAEQTTDKPKVTNPKK